MEVPILAVLQVRFLVNHVAFPLENATSLRPLKTPFAELSSPYAVLRPPATCFEANPGVKYASGPVASTCYTSVLLSDVLPHERLGALAMLLDRTWPTRRNLSHWVNTILAGRSACH